MALGSAIYNVFYECGYFALAKTAKAIEAEKLERELAEAKAQLQMTNSGWPHEKKLHEQLAQERAKSAELVEALECISKFKERYPAREQDIGDDSTEACLAQEALAKYKGGE